MIRERLIPLSNSWCHCGCASAKVDWQIVACLPERGGSLELLRPLRGVPTLDFARRRVNRAPGLRLARMCGVLLGVVLGARICTPKFPPKFLQRRTTKIFPKICPKKLQLDLSTKILGRFLGQDLARAVRGAGKGSGLAATGAAK